MKSIVPWFCLIAVANTGIAIADDGIDAYREGRYVTAAKKLSQAKVTDPVMDYYLGQMRFYGYGQVKNNTLALRYFKQAADKGFLPAQQLMARYTLLVEKNPEEALYWFKKAADANDVAAQMYCAAAYLYGVGTKKSPDIAKKYYIAAAKNGNSIAQFAVAESFFETKQLVNKKLGLLWLNKAVEQNNPEAQVLLGQLYLRGELVEHDVAKAKEMVGLAVAQNYLPALYEMGQIALSENQWEGAKEWFTKASNAHLSRAEVALSELYANEKNPFHDAHTAFLWMLKAAQNGSLEAQQSLAYMYKNGLGVEADEHLAAEWEQKATTTAKQAMNDQQKALQWLTNGQATSFNDTDYRLRGLNTWQNPSVLKENNYNQPPQMERFSRASLYQPKFEMTNPNLIPMSEYYDALVHSLGELAQEKIIYPQYPLNKRAVSAQKDAKNDANVNPVLKDGAGFDYLQHLSSTSDKPDYKSAFKKLERQAILGDSTAQFDLGQMYQQGLGVDKDLQQAIKYYRLAANQQDLKAQYNLGLLYLQGDVTDGDAKTGIELLRDAAFKGNPFAQYVIARIDEQGLTDGKGHEIIKPDHEQAMAMYQLASANDYGPAQYRLAEILVREKQNDLTKVDKRKLNQQIKSLYQGAVAYGVPEAILPLAFYNAMDKQPEKQAQAFAAAKTAAEAGNTNAALLLGLMYDRGVAVKASQNDALKWYKKAALNPVTAFVLGTYYGQGIGVAKDLEKSKTLLQQAADANFGYAHLNLAILKQQQHEDFLPNLNQALALGNNTAGLLLADYYLSLANNDQQMKQAHEIYQYFAERGDKVAQLKLAYLYEQGLGGPVDMVNAEKWYGLAAKQGQPVAQYLLGRLYQLGWVGKQPDYLEAKKWYAVAQVKYSPAAVARGFIYDTVDDDYQQALADYQRAALRDDPVAQFNIGLIYEKGKGQPSDFTKAKEMYLKAAEKGHRQAMVQLAGLYLNGLVGARDEQQALQWYTKAANLGDRDALYQLGVLAETGVMAKADYPKAIQYYQQAVNKGHVKATLALARMYQYGLGVPKDIQQAEKLYHELSEFDNPSKLADDQIKAAPKTASKAI